MNKQLIEFLTGTGTDNRGRQISQIMSWTDHQLEASHDYIQWVFPTPSRSRFNHEAPVLDPETTSALLNRPAAIDNVRQMLMRLYAFYSFKVISFPGGTYQLDLANGAPTPWWITPQNHNFLRITRILQSLKCLGLDEDIYALADMLDVLSRRHHDIIGDVTIGFWRDFIEV